MKILLLSSSPIIIKFLKIASKDLNADLEILEVVEKSKSKSNHYDFIVIDESITTLSCGEVVPKNIKYSKSVLLLSKGNGVDENRNCDFYLTKPFLPSDIIAILSGKENENRDLDFERESNQFFLEIVDIVELEKTGINKNGFNVDPEQFIKWFKQLSKIFKENFRWN